MFVLESCAFGGRYGGLLGSQRLVGYEGLWTGECLIPLPLEFALAPSHAAAESSLEAVVVGDQEWTTGRPP